jgi:hypothetical protein
MTDPYPLGSRWRYWPEFPLDPRMRGATVVIVPQPPRLKPCEADEVWMRFDDPALANTNRHSGGCWHTETHKLTPDPT